MPAEPESAPSLTPATGATGRTVWVWGILEALAGSLWSGPTAAFLTAFAVELGAEGAQLGLLLALNTLLANGLQLHGAQWTRRGRTDRRVYLSATVSRGVWLLAGVAPAALALSGRPGPALWLFTAILIVSSVATAAASPAMGARAGTASPEAGRTRYLADRMMALWLGALLGTAGLTAVLAVYPGPQGYALGFAAAAGCGLAGIGAYAMLLRGAARARAATPPDAAQVAHAARPLFEPEAERLDETSAAPHSVQPLRATAPALPTASIPPTPPTLSQPTTGWWPRLARRLGAPPSLALGELVLAAAILQGGASMIGPAAPIWLVRYLGAPTSFLGTVSLASSLAAIASQRFWARGIERWGADRVLGYSAAGAAFIPVGWMLAREPWVALVLSAYGGVAWGGYTLAMTARLLEMAPEAERPAYLGAYAAAVGAAGAVGSIVAGAITQAVPLPWIPVVFLLSFLVRGLGWAGLSRRSSRAAEEPASGRATG